MTGLPMGPADLKRSPFEGTTWGVHRPLLSTLRAASGANLVLPSTGGTE